MHPVRAVRPAAFPTTLFPFSSLLVLAAVLLALAACALPDGGGLAGGIGHWQQFHGEVTNTGLADVITAIGDLPVRKVAGLGDFAPGAGPVVAPDGTVYLGNIQGNLRAFTPAGDQKWLADIPGFKIIASPAVDDAGAVFVVGSRVARDHRGGLDIPHFDSTLNRFAPDGTRLWTVAFPEHGSQGTGATSASPVVWRSGSDEMILASALYRSFSSFEVHVMAFATDGALLFDRTVTSWSDDSPLGTDTDWAQVLCTFFPFCMNQMFGNEPVLEAPQDYMLDYGVEPPQPGIGLYPGAGGAPIVVVPDDYENIVGYSFSRAQGFVEMFRKHITREQIRMSSPVLLADGHSAIRGNAGDQTWLFFAGPSALDWSEVPVPTSGSMPTVTADGKFAIVERGGGVTTVDLVPSRAVAGHVALKGESIAPAAASCTHVFVSTANQFVTLDAAATTVLSQFDWAGGGLSSPAIGRFGAVYAVAGNDLFVFKAPPRGFNGATTAQSCLGGGASGTGAAQ